MERLLKGEAYRPYRLRYYIILYRICLRFNFCTGNICATGRFRAETSVADVFRHST
ncbi:MAG: hypothetical protein LBL39_03280 [Planctomycetaceae bacterium]|nr:hypothetical protein [Planctomycetaceae bacterium]